MNEAGGLNSCNTATLCLHSLHFYEEIGFSLLLLKHTHTSWPFIFLIHDRERSTEKYFSAIGRKGVQAIYREWWGLGRGLESTNHVLKDIDTT